MSELSVIVVILSWRWILLLVDILLWRSRWRLCKVMSLVVLSILSSITIVVTWTRVLIILSNVFATDCYVFHIVTECTVLVIIMSWSICNFNFL
jgi:hypothetical protein